MSSIESHADGPIFLLYNNVMFKIHTLLPLYYGKKLEQLQNNSSNFIFI